MARGRKWEPGKTKLFNFQMANRALRVRVTNPDDLNGRDAQEELARPVEKERVDFAPIQKTHIGGNRYRERGRYALIIAAAIRCGEGGNR